ncbi:hypothetical protein [Mycolicibacterium arenosum]|uniref:Uncharacterized protein n=1 Tax=Mycolicibacterium arenosum TaxID=2952157 RepID=A0ABT1LY19_9MYCO|nr:hypothetical protein [Mycolicibacterium sp. CAU 1645]MCP9271798.1 hypothetical protein [Mycolicibacterium sp. CAU 1645]
MSETVGVAAPLLLGEVRFRRDGDRLCVDHAPSVMWFALYVLERCRAEPDVGLSYDGSLITLRAANGTWVWRLTGRRCGHRWSTDGEPFDMVEAVWPD